jgi:hypothetical protein
MARKLDVQDASLATSGAQSDASSVPTDASRTAGSASAAVARPEDLHQRPTPALVRSISSSLQSCRSIAKVQNVNDNEVALFQEVVMWLATLKRYHDEDWTQVLPVLCEGRLSANNNLM